MAITLTDSVRRLMLDALDATFNGGRLRLYAGARPASAAAAPTGTLIAEAAPLPADLYAPASAAAGAAKDLNQALTVTGLPAAGTGTAASWYRLESADGVHRADGDVTHTSGAGDLTLDNVSIASGQVVTITALPWQVP